MWRYETEIRKYGESLRFMTTLLAFRIAVPVEIDRDGRADE